MVADQKFLTITVPFYAWAILVLAVSSVPGEIMPSGRMWNWDKLAHAAEYAVFAYLLFRYLYVGRTRLVGRAAEITAFVGIVYGLLDELHQSIPVIHRCCAWQDFVADVTGVLVGLAAASYYYGRKALT